MAFHIQLGVNLVKTLQVPMVHSTYSNILKNIYKKVRKIVGIG
jgi:hypothetical protein